VEFEFQIFKNCWNDPNIQSTYCLFGIQFLLIYPPVDLPGGCRPQKMKTCKKSHETARCREVLHARIIHGAGNGKSAARPRRGLLN